MATFRAASTAGADNANTLNVNKPAGTVERDRLFAQVTIAQTEASGSPLPLTPDQITPPAGWTLVTRNRVDWLHHYLYTKAAGPAEPASYTFTFGRSAGVSVIVAAYSDLSGDVNAVASGGEQNDATPTAPSVTTTQPNALVLRLFAAAAFGSLTTPAGLTARASRQSVSGQAFALLFADETRAATGATGTKTSTHSAVDSVVDGSSGITVALFTNRPPNAPALISPVNNQAIDRAQPLVLEHQSSDPDTGDTQVARETRWRPVGAADWITTGMVASTVPAHTIPGGTLAAGEHEWQARTWDASGPGPFSGSEFFTAADRPAAPVFTVPAAGAIITAATVTATVTAPDVDALEWRVVGDTAGQPNPAVIIAAGGTIEDPVARSFAATGLPNNTTVHLQARVRHDGLLSDGWADSPHAVAYTPPAPATLVVTPVKTIDSPLDFTDAISVTITNPAPSGGQPAVTAYDLHRRETLLGGDGIRIKAGVAAGVVADFTPASGVEYEYQARAYGSNGTSSLSAWTDEVPVVTPVDPGDAELLDFTTADFELADFT